MYAHKFELDPGIPYEQNDWNSVALEAHRSLLRNELVSSVFAPSQKELAELVF